MNSQMHFVVRTRVSFRQIYFESVLTAYLMKIQIYFLHVWKFISFDDLCIILLACFGYTLCIGTINREIVMESTSINHDFFFLVSIQVLPCINHCFLLDNMLLFFHVQRMFSDAEQNLRVEPTLRYIGSYMKIKSRALFPCTTRVL